MSDEEKIRLFDEIKSLYTESTNELRHYFEKRRKKKVVEKKRIERGYTPKKKTKKEDFEKNFKNNLEIS